MKKKIIVFFVACAVLSAIGVIFITFSSSNKKRGREDSLPLFEGEKISSEYELCSDENDFEYVDKREEDEEETIELSFGDDEKYSSKQVHYSGVHLKPREISSVKETAYVIPVEYKGNKISDIECIQKVIGVKIIYYPDECIAFASVSLCSDLEEIYVSKDSDFSITSFITECDKLKKIYVSKDNRSVCFPRVDQCLQLNEVYLQDSVKVLDRNFTSCIELKTISLPDGLEIINNSFISLWKLEKLVIPESVRYISGSFVDCPKLTLVVAKGSYAEKYAIEHNLKFETR
ncbi:MAG: leucine-rich repeat protein [Lachnospiraceae bacterium]|nr:leucine-rich repeat protein [Lachnospiraceae bacterium]